MPEGIPEMEEKVMSKTTGPGWITRMLDWFGRLPVAVKGVISTVEFGLSAGCVWAAWTAGGDMALIIPALAFGLFFAVIGIATITELKRSSKLLGMGLSAILFLAIGGFLYWHFTPKVADVVAESPHAVTTIPRLEKAEPSQQPLAPPVDQKPPLVSTYKKMIFVCDKPEKPSQKERRAGIDRYIDILKKVFGYSVKSSVTDDEWTIEVIPEKPIGDGMVSLIKETLFFKRAGDQIFVTVTNDLTGTFAPTFEHSPVDLVHPLARTTMDTIEKMTKAEKGKCKFV
jgi:hypothetical protein